MHTIAVSILQTVPNVKSRLMKIIAGFLVDFDLLLAG